MPRLSQARAQRSTEFLQRVLSSQPAALLVVDAEGKIMFGAGGLSPRGVGGMGWPVGTHLVELIDEKDRPYLEDLLKAAASSADGETSGPTRVGYLDADAARRSTEVWCVNALKDPAVHGVCVLMLPESAYDRFDLVLTRVVGGASLEQVFGTLAQALRYPPVEAEGFIVMPAPDDRTVLRAPDVPGVPGPPGKGPWDDIFRGEQESIHLALGDLEATLRQAAKQAGFAAISCFGLNRSADGRPKACLVVWWRQTGSLSRAASMAVERAVALASLSVSHAAADAGLRAAAYRDPLTGLGNRRAFFAALESRVTAGDRPSVLYIDLDGFKAVNARLGHLAGDAVLRVAARRLASVMRPTDELARLGGDEFAVLCNGALSTENLVAIAERVVSQLNQPLAVGDGEVIDTGACVGIASDLPAGTPADTILAQADRALRDAQKKGRAQYAFADQRNDRMVIGGQKTAAR